MKSHKDHYVVQICANFRADFDIRYALSKSCKVLLRVRRIYCSILAPHTSAENKAVREVFFRGGSGGVWITDEID
jgi:hypothetical protein